MPSSKLVLIEQAHSFKTAHEKYLSVGTHHWLNIMHVCCCARVCLALVHSFSTIPPLELLGYCYYSKRLELVMVIQIFDLFDRR